MPARIEGVIDDGHELDKRQRFPSLTIKDDCPSCRKPYVKDLTEGYLSHPVVGVNEHTCWCEHCGHEWPIQLQLTLKLEVIS